MPSVSPVVRVGRVNSLKHGPIELRLHAVVVLFAVSLVGLRASADKYKGGNHAPRQGAARRGVQRIKDKFLVVFRAVGIVDRCFFVTLAGAFRGDSGENSEHSQGAERGGNRDVPALLHQYSVDLGVPKKRRLLVRIPDPRAHVVACAGRRVAAVAPITGVHGPSQGLNLIIPGVALRGQFRAKVGLGGRVGNRAVLTVDHRRGLAVQGCGQLLDGYRRAVVVQVLNGRDRNFECHLSFASQSTSPVQAEANLMVTLVVVATVRNGGSVPESFMVIVTKGTRGNVIPKD